LGYLRETPGAVGIALAVLAACGLAVKVLIPFWRGALTHYWAVMASFCLAVLVFHSVVPTSTEPRKTFMAVPVIVLFAVAGAHWLARWKWTLGAAVVGVFASGTFAIQHRAPGSGAVAAGYVMTHPELSEG